MWHTGSLLAWLNSSSAIFLRFGVWGLFAVSFAESSFFPVPPDLLLIPLCILNPRLALWYAFVCTTGSVIGGVFGHFIGWRAGRPLLSRLFSKKAIDQVDALFSRYGGWAVGIAAFTPIPYKVFTIASGVFRMGRTSVILASVIGRGGRFFLEAVIIMVLGQRGLEFISSNFEVITIGLTLLALAVWFLSRRTRLFHSAGAWLSARGARFRDVYQRRLRPLGAYGYYLGAGLGLAGTSAVLFAKLASEVLEREIGAFDTAVFNATHTLATTWLRPILRGIAALGTDWVLLLLAVAAAAYLWLARRHTWESATVATATVGSWVLNAFLQGIFRRPAPPGLAGASLTTYSFPSQHSLLAFSICGICAYLLWRGSKRSFARYGGFIFAVATGALIGVSRVCLALDYPSDVLAGYALGAFWVAVCVLGLETARYLQEHRA